MANRPDTPCSTCGKLLWSSDTSASADQRVCRPCRRARGSQTNGTVLTADCVVCGASFTFVKAGGIKPKTCSAACRKARQAEAARSRRKGRPCEDCGTVVSTSGGVVLCRPCARERVREVYRRNNRRRRAALRGAASEPYTLDEIAERDRYRCQLCLCQVDMEIPAPDPASPSIDHVLPLSAGGDDVRANVQLAHYGCNSAKGARGAQQLALVG